MKKKYIYLTLIITIGLTLIAFYSTQKQTYDGDELYSYTLANSKHGFMMNNIKINEWNSIEEIKNIFALNTNEILQIIPIYKNQAGDVHPPFYYLIFHIMSITSLNKFSKLPGILINMIAYIVTIIYLYKISEKILEKKEKYVPCILYTISIGMLSTALFIRMYMMLTMMCVSFTYHFLNITRKNNKKDLIKLSICIYLGFMTHYFFLIYAFFICLIYLIFLIINKNKDKITNFLKATITPVICGFITFPFALIHILKGERGTETQENLIKSNIIDNFKEIYERLNIEIFNNMMPIIILLLTVPTIYLIVKYKEKIKQNPFMLTITLTLFAYITITLKIIPIKSTRYFYCIYPIMITIGYYIVSKSIKNKYIKAITIITLITMGIITQIKYKPSWVYELTLKNNKDKNIIYVIKNDYSTIGESQYLINYNKIYYTNEQFENYNIINESKEDIVIKTDNIDLLERIIKNTKYKKYEQYDIGYILKK
jgi:hypothetical protein